MLSPQFEVLLFVGWLLQEFGHLPRVTTLGAQAVDVPSFKVPSFASLDLKGKN